MKLVPPALYIVLAVAWLLWLIPFFLAQRRRSRRAGVLDRRARWGMLMQALSFAVLWQGKSWEHAPAAWRITVAISLLVLANVLGWWGTKTLGQQWRLDAGLNADHELVRTGPYRFVRHPIYASMLCLLLGMGLLVSPWPLFVSGLLFFFIGTEIRVQVEDKLLASRFGSTFAEYSRSVWAYLPPFR